MNPAKKKWFGRFLWIWWNFNGNSQQVCLKSKCINYSHNRYTNHSPFIYLQIFPSSFNLKHNSISIFFISLNLKLLKASHHKPYSNSNDNLFVYNLKVIYLCGISIFSKGKYELMVRLICNFTLIWAFFERIFQFFVQWVNSPAQRFLVSIKLIKLHICASSILTVNLVLCG